MRWLFLVLTTLVPLGAGELTLEIEPRWNGARLEVPSRAVTNACGQVLRMTRLAMLGSGIVLHRADGATVRLDGQYGFFDAERGRNAWELENVPAGDYVALEFRVGLPAAVNHGDVARWPAGHSLNPLVNGLHWSWQGGYVFLALEGRWSGEGRRLAAAGEAEGEGRGERGFLYHIATDARAMPVGIRAAFRVEKRTRVTLALDLGKVLGAMRLAEEDGSESTHSGEGDDVAVRIAEAVERAWFWLGAEEVQARRAAEVAGEKEAREWKGRRVKDNAPYPFAVPPGFPQPELPADNPLTMAGVELGRKLFFDTRLSGNGRQACAGCHAPERALSDIVALSVGAEGRRGGRNAMPLFNLAWQPAYAWDGGKARVRDQAIAAMTNPMEMNATVDAVVARLREDAATRAGFAAVFGDAEVTGERVGLALEQFLLTIVHADSRLDRALRGAAELTTEETRGFELFMTEYDPARGRKGADCFHCHGGALLSDFGYRNNGVSDGGGDRGRAEVTGRTEDHAKFKTPSLRNVALTGPYMHDGRFATLEEVVAHYDHRVVRSGTLDPNLAKHPAGGMALPAEDRRALVAFLRTLTELALEDGAARKSAAQ